MITERRFDGSNEPYLRMVAQVGIADQLSWLCSTVSYGHCLCGLVAEKQEIVIRHQLDSDHHIRYDGIVDHGHVILPLISHGKLFGVMSLYLACQYTLSEDELDFLKTVATIAANLVHHQMDKNQLARTVTDLEITWHRSSEAHYWVTIDGSLEDANVAFLQMFGVDKGELSETSIRDLYWNPDDRRKATQILMDYGVLKQHEVCFRHHKTDEKIIGLISAQVRHDDAGKVIGYVGIIFDITKMRALEDQLRRSAYHDSLTGLANRALLMEKMDRILSRQRHNSASFTVCMMDLNGFKPVNDEYGHASGDLLLKLVARRLLKCIRPSDDISRHEMDDGIDTVVRLGGDEFVILFPGVDECNKAIKIIGRVITIFNEAFIVNEHSIRLGASIGVAIAPMHGSDAATLLKVADEEMYIAKNMAKKESPDRPVTRYRIAEI